MYNFHAYIHNFKRQIVNKISNEMAKVPFENGDFGENGRNGEQLLIPNGMTKGPF